MTLARQHHRGTLKIWQIASDSDLPGKFLEVISHQHLELVQRNSSVRMRAYFGLEEDALLKEFIGQ